jgi:Domain of unknown function (DUF4398)
MMREHDRASMGYASGGALARGNPGGISSLAMARHVCRARVLHVMPVHVRLIKALGKALGMAFAMTLGVALAACGPIVYVGDVTHHAADAVDEARAAHADKYAPYWWTRATQYLAKAREIAAYADFQGANRFGRLATEAANKATEEAQIAEKDPSKRPLEDHPGIAPAKEPSGSHPVPAKDPPPPSRVAPAKDAP